MSSERIKSTVQRHRTLFKTLFIILIAVIVFQVTKKQFTSIQWSDVEFLVQQLSVQGLVSMALLGLLCFIAAGLYDWVIARQSELSVGTVAIFTSSLISQAYNNFIGLGGISGGAIRLKFYTDHGMPTETAVQYSAKVWLANMTGLMALVLLCIPEAIGIGDPVFVFPVIACLYLPIFFFANHLHFDRLDLRNTTLGTMPMTEKVQLFIVSCLDWFSAAIFFFVTIELFHPGTPLILCLYIFAVASAFGIISFIPGGLGSFELVAMAYFSAIGYDMTKVAASILIYRLFYYVVPWVLSTIILLQQRISRAWLAIDTEKRQRLVIGISAMITLVIGVLLILSALSPSFVGRVRLIADILPRSVVQTNRLITFFIGILLIVFSNGIRARLKNIHTLTVGLLLIAVLAALAKGLDYEESLLMFLFALFLLPARKYFDENSLPLTRRNVGITLLLTIVAPLVIYVAWNATSLISPVLHQKIQWPHVAVFMIVTTLFAVVLLFSRTRKLSFVPPSDQDLLDWQAFCNTYGGNEYSTLFYLRDKNVFYNSTRTVAIQYRPQGDQLLALADPIGVREDFESAIDEFITFGMDHSMYVSFYEVSSDTLEIYCNLGFSILKIGEDAFVDLTTFNFVGNKNKGLRAMKNNFERSGMVFEIIQPPLSDAVFEELQAISDEWLGNRNEMSYSLGFFDRDYLSYNPIALVRSEQRIEGFASLMPVPGNKTVLSIDLMRNRLNAPNGTMDGLFIQLMAYGQEAGYTSFNLGMAPLSNVGNKHYSGSMEKSIALVYQYGNSIYSFRGLRHYKSKFKPEWHNRYMVYKDNRVLPAVLIALFRTTRQTPETATKTTPSQQKPVTA